MAALTIPDVPDEAMDRLRRTAAMRGESVEDHARALLLAGLAEPATWIDRLAQAGADYGDLDLPVVPDEPATAARFDRRPGRRRRGS